MLTHAHSVLIAALVLCTSILIAAPVDEKRTPDQKDAYKALVTQYPSTVEKGFKTDAQRQTWRKYVMTYDPVHVHITRISANYEGQLNLGGAGAYTLYKATAIPPNPDDWWRIEVFGEMTPSVQSVIIYISTTSKKIVLARFQPGE